MASVDPISLMVTALAAGASSAVQGAASNAVEAAYSRLRNAVKRRFRRNRDVISLLEKRENSPDAWRAALEQQLAGEVNPDDDTILAAARDLLVLIDPEGARVGKYNVSIHGGRGIVVGDSAHVTMAFSDEE